MTDTIEIRFKRGPASRLPVDAPEGEPLFTTDDDKPNIYVGKGPGTPPVKVTGVTEEIQAAIDMKANAADLGTAAAKDVPASGNATAGQVVLGSDTRLSNSRTPTAHKSTHATGGTDAITPADIGAAPDSALATYNVNQTAGVDSTGTNECAAALQVALNDAATQGLTAVGTGSYKIGSKVVIKSNADFSNATFNVVGTPAIAVEVSTGDAADPSTELSHATIKLPAIINTAKTGTGWDGYGAGVRFVSLINCFVTVKHVQGFGVGVDVSANNTNGSVDNHIFLGHLDNNKVNLRVLPMESGSWCNENNFYGGKFQHNSGEGTDVPGVRHILIASATHPSNNNLFLKPNLEGNTPEFHLECWGVENLFQSARWEATTPKVAFKGASNNEGSSNTIFHGYGASNIVVTKDATSIKNRIYAGTSTLLEGSAAASSGVIVLKNTSSSSNPSLVVVDSAVDASSDLTSTYNVSVTAQSFKGKRTTDTYPRVKYDFVNGRVYMGNGTADPLTYIGQYGATDFIVVGGNLYFGGTYNTSQFVIKNTRVIEDSFGMLRVKSSAFSSDTDGLPLGKKVAVPANATAAGAPGQWAADASYLYVYTGDGTAHAWRRSAIGTW